MSIEGVYGIAVEWTSNGLRYVMEFDGETTHTGWSLGGFQRIDLTSDGIRLIDKGTDGKTNSWQDPSARRRMRTRRKKLQAADTQSKTTEVSA